MSDDFIARISNNLGSAYVVERELSAGMSGVVIARMPHVEGESLRSRLAVGLPPLHESLRWLRDVATALAYAHSRGIVHRDMKPDNILLSGGYAP